MPRFSQRSKDRLATVHPDLQKVFNEVIKIYNISIVEGVRSVEKQKKLVAAGASKTMNSKHIVQSDGYSHAVDVGVFIDGGIEWDDLRYYYYLAGIVKATASRLNINLRWGGDWDSDGDFSDQSFNDLVHWEIKK